MTTVVGYLRVSTREQADSGAGLAAQRSAIESEATRRGWTVRWLEDAGVSGADLNRPALTEALAILKRREAVALVVAKLDRLSRSVPDFGKLLKRAEREGWAVVCLDLALDMTTPTGKLVANIITSVAEWERDVIAQRTRDALAERRGVVARYASREVRERVLALHEAGMSGAGIARALDAERVPAPGGGPSWHPSTVRRMITSARKAGRLRAVA